MWIFYAFMAALFAGLTSILAKIGIKNTDSHVATALRTIVIVIFAWLMVFVVGSQNTIATVSKRSFLFLILSGITTGASWLAYFKALQIGDINKVVPLDKSSTILTMLLAFVVLQEPISSLKIIAMIIIGSGTYMMITKPKKEQSKQMEATPNQTAKQTTDQTMKSAGKQTITNVMASSLSSSNEWLIYALLSAIFASLTAILGKIGVQGIESNLATAIRTIVILIMAWLMVFGLKKQHQIKQIDRKSWLFIGLSGLATGLSWLFYYRALKDGLASIVVPIDKLSIVVSITFGYFVWKEKLTRIAFLGLLLVVGGTLLLVVK